MPKKKKERYEPKDDGRVIAPMNVEGMPWYMKREQGQGAENTGSFPETLSPAEKRAFTWGVLKAALLVSAVFVIAYLGFILFCTNIWLK